MSKNEMTETLKKAIDLLTENIECLEGEDHPTSKEMYSEALGEREAYRIVLEAMQGKPQRLKNRASRLNVY